ncbi:uncharacterized protein LOC111272913 isoform X2 [Varroa jacobsoni]|uniref:uncharacterized protein LOC111272913 isoform X2 n=1 Tax=Varroa jacobsoni TaxID=62625 RepID=UPI000BF725D0|nr:uncharacterized protein LOC111272913 isoform X2 [Varroa jacobsoni]
MQTSLHAALSSCRLDTNVQPMATSYAIGLVPPKIGRLRSHIYTAHVSTTIRLLAQRLLITLVREHGTKVSKLYLGPGLCYQWPFTSGLRNYNSIETMKSSRWLTAALLLLQLAANEAFLFSLGLVGLGVVGLASLKVCYGMKAKVGEGQPMLNSIFHAISRYRTPKQEIQDVEKQIVPVEEVQENPMLHVPAVQVDPYPSVASTRSSTRARRALLGGVKISEDLFRWIAKIDDEKCIHRFFCYLGAKPRSFGNVGRLIDMVIIMEGLPDDSWAVKMHRSGQRAGLNACPTECSDRQLLTIVSNLEKHIFETSTTPIIDFS